MGVANLSSPVRIMPLQDFQINVQLSLRVPYPYRRESVVHKPEFKDEHVRTAQALFPFYDIVLPP